MLLCVGCSKSEDVVFSVNSVTLQDGDGEITRVLFSSEIGDQVDVKVAMMEDWYVEMVSNDGGECDFALSKISGNSNSYETIVFESTTTNSSNLQNSLGVVNIISSSSGEQLCSLSVEQSRKPGAQTTLTYFTGTSLKSYFNVNISDAKLAIEAGVLGDYGRYLYLIHSTSTTASLYEITLVDGVCVETLIKSYSDFRSLNEGSFSMVMEDVKSYIDFDTLVNGESQRMNLVVSGHGTGWIQYSAGVLSTALSMTSLTEEWEVESPLHPTRYMGSSGDGYMDISEFAEEIDAAGVKFGFILFDECFMSSVELLYRIRDCADYVIASPCEIMAAGFPYTEVLPYMSTQNGTNYDLQGICEAYYDFYTTNTIPCGCVAVCVTSELEALAAAQSRLEMRELSSSEIAELQTYEGRSGDHVFFDLKQYVNLAGDGSLVADLEAYNTQYDKTFPEECRLNTDYFYTNIGSSTGKSLITYYSGVTTSAPTTSRYSSSWALEPWSVATTSAAE